MSDIAGYLVFLGLVYIGHELHCLRVVMQRRYSATRKET